ncbi:pteridine reductase [Plasticicumulans acidivorans]|uniref:Pteridine reductase n=1 Tax=Plasticicumulans acidivorans TaxID=886464 RepID=A0A317MW39_9GAMM|nr:pteridine reductase [Plasticicumulans acidivorans]PWV62426.1 pteridine reductase [Plasticicumulans acidivorans]
MEHNIEDVPTALITGGARRIGACIARELHAAGMRLIIHYRQSRAEARRLQEELEAVRPASVALVQADLLDTAQLPRLLEQSLAVFGRIDALVNNASSFYPTPLGTATLAQWDDLLGSNLRAPFFLMQAAAPALRTTHGCIVNLIDLHAQRPMDQYAIYCAAKAGLASLTRSFARELAPEVRVNGIAPGAILWPEHAIDDAEREQILERVPLRRPGSPEDIARTVRFLVCEAPYITGQIIAVDGGRTTGV